MQSWGTTMKNIDGGGAWSRFRWVIWALVLGTGGIPTVWAAPQDRPNILLFFTDDQRATTIGALGNRDIHTPNLDKLVARGCSFTRAYMMGGMTGATCVPSRAMLHTGRHLFHLRNRGSAFSPEDRTLAETLRASGYTTYFSGKRHSLNRAMIQRSFDQGGVVMGFGGYLTDKRRMPMHDWDPAARYEKQDAYIVSGAPGHPKVPVPKMKDRETVPAGPYATQLYVDPAVQWIESYQAERPWFMYVSLSAPHDPHEAPESIRRLYDPNKIPLPPNFQPRHPFDNGDLKVRDEKLLPWPRDPQRVRQQIADYYAAITFLDGQFGRLIKALEQSGQLDSTLVVFAGDSGLAVGQHGLLGKQNLYDEGGVHIPLIMAGPGIPKDHKRNALVASCDLFPTLCELTGTEIPTCVEGKSMRSLLHDDNARTRDRLYLAYREYQRAVVESRFKLIEYVRVTQTVKGKTQTAGTRFTQLFDMQQDPWETTNLAADPQHAVTLRRLQQTLQTLRQEHDDGTARGKQRCPEMHDQYRLFWNNYN